MALTKKEKTFCEEYVNNGYNSSQAYQKAYGCSIEDARKRYCKTFRKPEVKEYIAALQSEAFAAAAISAERIALKLADIAFAGKTDDVYVVSAQLKALDLLQKQFNLQKQTIEADVNTNIIINIDDQEEKENGNNKETN